MRFGVALGMNVTAIAPFVLATCVLVTTSAALGGTTATVRGVDFLRVRAEPSFDAAETTILSAGDTVEIVEELGFWAAIVLPNGTRGYVSRKYLAAAPAEQPQVGSAGAAEAPSVETPPAVGAGGTAAVEGGDGATASGSGISAGSPAAGAGADAQLAPGTGATPARPLPATVKGANFLRVRTAPSFDAAEVAILRAGNTVEIVEELGFWAAIVLRNGTRGYVSRKYLATTSAEQAQTGSAGAAPPAETAPVAEGGGTAVVEGAEGATAGGSGTGGGPAVVATQPPFDARIAPTPPTSAEPAATAPPAASLAERGDDAAARDGNAGAPAAEARADTHLHIPSAPAADSPPAAVPPPSPVEETAVHPAPAPISANGGTPGSACTRADVDALRADVRALTGMMTVKASVAATPGAQAAVLEPFPPDRPQLIWFGIGGLVGWLLGRISAARDRWRRNRIRI
jgi:SH3-like domain-containing protein